MAAEIAGQVGKPAPNKCTQSCCNLRCRKVVPRGQGFAVRDQRGNWQACCRECYPGQSAIAPARRGPSERELHLAAPIANERGQLTGPSSSCQRGRQDVEAAANCW